MTRFRTILAASAALAFAASAAGSLAAAPRPHVLFVLSSANRLYLRDGSKIDVGFYSTEFATPWKILEAAGCDLDVATPHAKKPTVGAKSLDPRRFKGGKKEAEALKAWLAHLPQLQKPLALEKVKVSEYHAIFVPGGLAPMQDLAFNPVMGKLLRDAFSQDRILALLCHGPAALMSAASGTKWPFRGMKMTAYSDEEESDHLDKRMKVTPEGGLKQMGAQYSKAPKPHTEWVVHDHNLITGENPESAEKLGHEVFEALKKIAD